MTVVRILIWNLADSKTTLADVRQLLHVDEGNGKEPEIAEEFDALA